MEKELKGEHEDLIFKNREFIKEIEKVQDLYFKTLVLELGLNEKGEEWLFDYIFNGDLDLSFSEYLADYSIPENHIFKQ
jgi:hypothetical protein